LQASRSNSAKQVQNRGRGENRIIASTSAELLGKKGGRKEGKNDDKEADGRIPQDITLTFYYPGERGEERRVGR